MTLALEKMIKGITEGKDVFTKKEDEE
jgi:hypothetical protein